MSFIQEEIAIKKLNMKHEKLEMKREVWEYFRLYRQAPIKKRYQELLEYEEIDRSKRRYKKMFP